MKNRDGAERSIVLLLIDPKTYEITFADEKLGIKPGALPANTFHVPLMKNRDGAERSIVLLLIDPKTYEITFADEKL
ncbi:hypothetical protein F1714_12160, partial [Streptococcus pneumoniae]